MAGANNANTLILRGFFLICFGTRFSSELLRKDKQSRKKPFVVRGTIIIGSSLMEESFDQIFERSGTIVIRELCPSRVQRVVVDITGPLFIVCAESGAR